MEWSRSQAPFGRGETPGWIDGIVPNFRGRLWAPDVVAVEGEFRLYYSASQFGKQTSAIGLVVSKDIDPNSPDYGWTDRGPVIRSSPEDEYNAIDPSIFVDHDGRHWMAFGSYWRGIYLVELAPESGLRLSDSQPPVRLAWNDSIEAATLIRRGEYYYLFVNHGQCCRGIHSTYEILVGRSQQIEGPYVDRQGNTLLDGGGTLVLGSYGPMIGPGHVAPFAEAPTERFAFHYYDGNERGRSKLATARWEWSEEGWPSPTDVRLSISYSPNE